MSAAAWNEALAGPDDDGRRLDRVLRRLFPYLPLSALHRMFRTGDVRVGAVRARPDTRIASGDRIRVRMAPGAPEPSADLASAHSAAAPGPAAGTDVDGLLLVLRDGVLYLNKPRGILVHDGPDSLEALVRRAYPDSGAGSLSFRPGPLHRLDRNTSGVVAFSLSLRGAARFLEAMRAGRIEKRYLAVLDGLLMHEATWRDRLVRDTARRISRSAETTESRDPGSEAITRILPLARSNPERARPGRTLALMQLETGRTHQIRAQAALHGHPLSGDKKYGSRSEGPYLLHAWSLRILESPGSAHSDESAVTAPLPDYFTAALRGIFELDQEDLCRLTEGLPVRGAS